MSVICRTQSCYVGGLGEDDRDEVVAEMDDKIKQLKAAVNDKDAELEKLKETVKALQAKLSHDEKPSVNGNSDAKDDITA